MFFWRKIILKIHKFNFILRGFSLVNAHICVDSHKSQQKRCAKAIIIIGELSDPTWSGS